MKPFIVCFTAVLMLASAAVTRAQETPPPLTKEQAEQIRALVQRTQTEQTRLRTALTAAQEKLAACYLSYELDEKKVTELHQEIIELQQSLLGSYHAMHKELRALVTPERFKILSRRIENALKTAPAPKE